MKRVTCVLLAVLMVFCLIGCSDAKKVKEQLCGVWGYSWVGGFGNKTVCVYAFSADGTLYENIAYNYGTKKQYDYDYNGTYVIENGKIVCSLPDFGDDYTKIIDYKFDDEGNLELYYNDFQMIKAG